jgi:O-antigen ligase/tetratricopeptide (TPR) repeat protein
MEAAWIAAVIIVPVFYNIYSSRIFEPDKITILRSLALIILFTWIIKIIEDGGLHWEKLDHEDSQFKSILKIPIIFPVVLLAIIYIIATIFSVTPRISLLGSYQRLQGTYTTLSYILIFAAIVGNLRKRAQVERLITAAILASLPVSLYGILQRYQIDPVPWGGNVSNRIASTMGNSIFVAAYLIMVIPLTVGRIINSFRSILTEEKNLTSHVIRATIYVFIVAVELIAVYMSGSRGPLLGLLAGLFFMFVLLSVFWRKRLLTLATVGGAIIVGAFLITLNIPNGPLEGLRDSPWIGRFGHVIDMDQRTSQVRILIWQGAAELVSPHDPIVFPDGGTDKLNFLRPLIGYGPESMYVAYNQFYPPELGRVEKRNASPDRSHNETWDSLVITGVLGLLAYLLLFGFIFYYSMKWLGLIQEERDRNLFILIYIGGGLIGGIGATIWQGVEFIGVGVPFGIILGVIGYLTLFSLFRADSLKDIHISQAQAVTIIVMTSAIAAHFVEINFGIAIVATRTLFWVFTGSLLTVGYILPKYGEYSERISEDDQSRLVDIKVEPRTKKFKGRGRKKYGRKSRASLISRQPSWTRLALVGALLVSILLITLGYDFISNSIRSTSIIEIITSSLSKLPNKDGAVSYGIMALILTTWLAFSMVVTSENTEVRDWKTWLKSFALTAGVSAGITFVFWLWHAGSLVALAKFTPANTNDVLTQVSSIGGLLTSYYIFVFLILLSLAFFLPASWPARSSQSSWYSLFVAPVVFILVVLGISYGNLRVIQADISFKMAEPFTKSEQWAVSTFLYKEALEMAPNEDHYYLFLGRSYLEQAKLEENIVDQDNLILQAEQDLIVAQNINPLNTDHTANLGRLFSWWAGRAPNGEVRKERGDIASGHYGTAVTLSPYNPNLWNEWAILYMDIIHDMDESLVKLEHSLSLDNLYSWTHALYGDYYLRIARTVEDEGEKFAALEKSADHYKEAVRVATGKERDAKIGYLVSQGNVYIEIANSDPANINVRRLEQARDIYEQAVSLGPKNKDLWRIEETLAKLFAQTGDINKALEHAYRAHSAAPERQKERIQNLIAQIEALP